MIMYTFTIVLLSILAIMCGRIIFLVSKRKFFPVLVRKAMNYCNLSKTELENTMLGILYYVFPILCILVLCIAYRYPVYKMFWIAGVDIKYIPIAIIAYVSLLSGLSGLAGLFFPKTDWVNVISNVSWIQSVNTRNNTMKFFALVLGAFVEELFFRGICFSMVFYKFPQYSVWITLVISALLFGIEQSLFMKDKKSVFIFMLSSISMGILGSVLILYTNSILPSLVAHEFFVLFYFVNFNFKH